MKIKNMMFTLCVMLCMVFMIKVIDVKAAPTNGTAYAVLTDDGELILFRSNNSYSDGTGQTVTDLNGDSYTGQVYTGIETTNTNDTNNSKWYNERTSVLSVRVAANQTIQPVNCCNWFNECSNCTSIDLIGLDTANVNNMSKMFYNCYNLSHVHISNLNTSNVTDMRAMFSKCIRLVYLDLLNFNTSNVTNMTEMFYGCSSITSLDLSGFNTSAVTNMSFMFNDCINLTYLDISNFNTSHVGNMSYMFWSCTRLSTVILGEYFSFKGNHIQDSSLWAMLPTPFGESYTDKWKWKGTTNISLTTTELQSYYDSTITGVWKWELKGTAYAVLTNSGELILFRSENVYSDDARTVTDINGNTYTGVIYTEIETNNTSNPKWYSQRTSIKSVRVGENQVIRPVNCSSWFYECSNCIRINLTGIDMSNVTSMNSMFYNCSKLTNLDLSNINAPNVTNMYSLFNNCTNLASINMSNFNAVKVTSINGLFYRCNNLNVLDMSNFNAPNITDINLFDGLSKLTELNLSGFNTSHVTSMTGMFSGCSSLTNLDLSGLDVSNVTSMNAMFQGCSSLTNLDLSGLNVSNVTGMNGMFAGCSSLTNLDLSGLKLFNLTGMSGIFSGCINLVNLNLSNFNAENLTSLNGFFSGLSKLSNINFSGFSVPNVRSVGGMFSGCSSLTDLDLSGINLFNLNTMNGMFVSCNNLISLDMSNINAPNVTNMAGLFSELSKLTNLNLSGFNTSKVTNMGYMFYNCNSLTDIDVSGFNTSKVTNMSHMFYNCSSLTDIDVSGFNTSKVTDMRHMFYNCSNVSELDVSEFDTSKVTNTNSMFYNCSCITDLNLSGFNTLNATNMTDMFENCSQLFSVTLSPNFSFKGNGTTSCELPTPPIDTPYTGEWMRYDEEYGPYESSELSDLYTSEMTGEWVWAGTLRKYTVQFITTDGTGSMRNQKILATESGTIKKNEFQKFNAHFDHWEGDNGNTYEDEGNIPANEFSPGETLTLRAVFERNINYLNQSDGIATVTMHGGEKITLPDLKGGVTYQIWEDTPSGWQLATQTNPAGKIMANETIDSSFTNEYAPGTATIMLMAQKTLDGQMPEDDAFEFVLKRNDEVIHTVTNKSGMVTFKPITFTQPGTYVYTISEVRGDDDGINYDPHTETITINVTDDENGNLTATTDQNELPLFENMTKPGTLTIKKETDIATDETFTFEIVLENEYGQPLDQITVLKDN